MDQHEIKVSFPLRTKLLVSILFLMLSVILFLDFSTILLVNDDKKAYTFQSQSVESVLAGNSIKAIAENSLGTLRLGYATYVANPTHPNTGKSLFSLVSNQQEVIAILFQNFDGINKTLLPLFAYINQSLLQKSSLQPKHMKINFDWVNPAISSLKADGFAFINLSQVGLPPTVGVLFTDLTKAKNSDQFLIALGIVQVDDLSKEIKGSAVTIATSDGRILFDSDPSVLYAQKSVTSDPLFLRAYNSKVASGASEYEFEGESFIGSFYRPGFNLIVLSKTTLARAMRATYTLIEKYVLLACIAIGCAIIFSLFFSRSLTAPLNRLYEATREVAKGNFNLSLKSKSKDEIGALSHSFNAMAQKITDLIKEQVEATRMESELAIASTVQQTLIPKPELADQDIYIKSHYESASECGGDWWGSFRVGNKMALLIADATGHGIPSALITAAAHSCFSVLHKLVQEKSDFELTPGNMLSYANRVIYESASAQIMMTFFASVIDFEQKKMIYANAGHNPPWLFRKTDSGYSMKSLTSKGVRLGEQLDLPSPTEASVDISNGDILFLYTDGIMEGTDTKGKMFGKKQVKKIVETSLSGGPNKVIEDLVGKFKAHSLGKPFDDDITLVVSEFFPINPKGGQA